jgi:hypothetical protein
MDENYAAQRYTDAECEEEFAYLFPQGFAGQDVLDELAPEGWEASPLVATFHPSLEQVYDEAVQMHRNMQSWPWRQKDRPPDPEPTREEVAQRYRQEPGDTAREARELVGRCLWDVFSDNHDVIAPDGRLIDIGSFRGAGGFIADCLNREIGAQEYDYMDFYMGTIWIAQRADLTPVYRMIFRRLKARGHEWRYAFPRLGLVDLRPLRKAMGGPTGSVEDEAQRDRALAELRQSLDASHRQAVEAAWERPPPETVQAYQGVYGWFPEGWPPEVSSSNP